MSEGIKFKRLDVEEQYEKDVVVQGNGAHVLVPKKHLGKKARVMILRGKK